VLAVSTRYSGSNETQPLDPYVRVDLYTEYKIDQTWKVYLRGENLFNEHYQEVFNYGTTGPAAYVGFNAHW
jgi:vitamin B12 transporter